MNFNFSAKISLRVRYGETDQMGYCYYGNYASFFEVGRVEALRELGLSYKEMEDQGIMLPVSHFEVDYLSPTFYDDLLTVETKIVSLQGARLFFEYNLFNEKGKLCSVGKTTLVFVSKESMRPMSAPKDFLDLMNKFLVNE
ncbi:MAG: acyl-CoA thioesterase [Fluviicola sp.]|jgi:acyl-CoA thioester hydrolase